MPFRLTKAAIFCARKIPNALAIEMEYPLRVEEYSLVEDSGGAGRWRGGLGLRRVVRPVGHACEFSGVGERFRLAPPGIFGGEPGRPGRFDLRKADGTVERLPGKLTGLRLDPTSAVSVETPGAGGYGPADRRDQHRVVDDSASGKFGAAFAAAHYPSHEMSADGGTFAREASLTLDHLP